MPRYLPWGFTWMMSCYEPLTPSKTIQLPVTPAQLSYSPFWPTGRAEHLQASCDCPGTPIRGVITAWERTKRQDPLQGLPLSLSPSLGSAGAVPLPSAPSPWMSEPSAFQSLFWHNLWTHSSPEIGQQPLYLIPGSNHNPNSIGRQFWGGVGGSGCRWAAAATVGKNPPVILEMFKPLTISCSHTAHQQDGNDWSVTHFKNKKNHPKIGSMKLGRVEKRCWLKFKLSEWERR